MASQKDCYDVLLIIDKMAQIAKDTFQLREQDKIEITYAAGPDNISSTLLKEQNSTLKELEDMKKDLEDAANLKPTEGVEHGTVDGKFCKHIPIISTNEKHSSP